MRRRQVGLTGAAVAAVAVVLAALIMPTVPARASSPSVEMAAPYEYLGWGNPPPPTQVMAATGIHDFTMAFILSDGTCNPEWDGSRPLSGGVDASTIASIRAAGGEVAVSFGGWSGNKLGVSCTTPSALAAAYQKVINVYSLTAIDVDIEHTEIGSATVRQRVITALASVHRANPGLEISVTFGGDETGPDKHGKSLIAAAADIGFQPNAWTIMPFDFGVPVTNMAAASIEAAKGLESDLVAAYHVTPAVAYQHVGISSMNGKTDDSGETVTLANFEAIEAFATAEHLARLSFWSVNRDRPCTGTTTSVSSSCSGIAQPAFAFTSALAQFDG